MSEQEHRITSEFKKWADDKDPLKLMTDKPVAKTPDDIQRKIRGMRDEAKRMEGLGLCTCDLDKFEPERNTWHTLECKCHKIAVEKSSRGEL